MSSYPSQFCGRSATTHEMHEFHLIAVLEASVSQVRPPYDAPIVFYDHHARIELE